MIDINTLPDCTLHVTGSAALKLYKYPAEADVIEVCNKCHVSGTKYVDTAPPLRYTERLVRYNDKIMLLSKVDILLHLLCRWSNEDIKVLKDSGLSKDVSEVSLVTILNREYGSSMTQTLLNRFVEVKYS